MELTLYVAIFKFQQNLSSIAAFIIMTLDYSQDFLQRSVKSCIGLLSQRMVG